MSIIGDRIRGQIKCWRNSNVTDGSTHRQLLTSSEQHVALTDMDYRDEEWLAISRLRDWISFER